MQTKVSIGWASILGWAGFAGAMLTSVVQSLESGTQLLHGPSKLPGLVGIAFLALTNAGRQLQARGLPGASQAAELEREVPAVLRELARENEARVAAHPDGVDGPHVPFASADEIDRQAAVRAASSP